MRSRWVSKVWLGLGLALVILSMRVFSTRQVAPSSFILHPSSLQELPPGPGAELIRRDCLTCHEADLIVQQRLTRALWGRELDKMVRWGAAVSPQDREPMLTYLAAHFGDPSAKAARPATALPPGRGADRVGKSCLTCHEADIIAGQFLTRAQWERELDKMARWGAVFSSEDRELMLDYLAAHFGPERVE